MRSALQHTQVMSTVRLSTTRVHVKLTIDSKIEALAIQMLYVVADEGSVLLVGESFEGLDSIIELTSGFSTFDFLSKLFKLRGSGGGI